VGFRQTPMTGAARITISVVGRRFSRLAWIGLWLVLGVCLAPVAHAACMLSADPQILWLQMLSMRDAGKALQEASARITALKSASTPDGNRLAALYAVQAQSYSELELDGQAREAAARGLALIPGTTDPTDIDLLTAYADNVYDEVGMRNEAVRIDAAHAAQPTGSMGDICLLITLGRLQRREARSDLAISTLMRAYRASMAPDLSAQRAQAAAELATVMRVGGDFEQALDLNQESLNWDEANYATLELAVTRYQRGMIYNAMRNYPAALTEFTEARELSVMVNGWQVVAFADMQICGAQIELGRYADAKAHCESAVSGFKVAHATDTLQQTMALLARIELDSGHADTARIMLNDVLDSGTVDMLPEEVTPIYELRARANATAGRYEAAYADLIEYLRRANADTQREEVQQAAIQRAHFQIDRQLDRNASLQRELVATRDREAHQAIQLRWTILIIVIGGVVAALLVYLLAANMRHRRQLLRLAELDMLTGLPNRRRTAQLALAAISDTQTPLTFVLIDLDHFKIINDRCGHAAGDQVLQRFAAVSRVALRATDIMGRWGGEEFLLILPDTPLDVAMEVIERLRTQALAIELPAAAEGLLVSFSAGLAARGKRIQSLEEIIASADAALYEAKNAGRDLVRIDKESVRTASTGVRQALAESDHTRAVRSESAA
jgi:diguanylate cyclase (GGDEF)-like protein